MDCETIKTCLNQMRWIDYTTLLATVSAVIAASSAFFSHRLSKNIYDEIKSDEVVFASKIQHPDLHEHEHAKSVLYFTLLNKSHRKATITSLQAFENNGDEVDIKWSDSIDHLGNIQQPTGLLGLKDSAEIFIRRTDGGSYFITTIRIKHSFDENGLELIHTP